MGLRFIYRCSPASDIIDGNTSDMDCNHRAIEYARAILQHRIRQGLAVYQKENPGKALKAGWETKKLTVPTFQLLFEYSRNHDYLKTGSDEYSFCFDSGENEVRLTILLSLMNLTVSDLI